MIAPGPGEFAAGNHIDLETALQWTLQYNPDLVARRQDICVSAAALAVARQFPTNLNPSVAITIDPWVWETDTGQGNRPLQTLVSIEWTQPIEFGRRTALRTAIARAEYTQTQWNILQAELMALVATYRLHQTAAYRKEKLDVAEQLSRFNGQLVEVLRRQVAANQAPPADLALTEVENQAILQETERARQEYLGALADLRRQIGIAQYAATIEPAGGLVLPEVSPVDEVQLLQTALKCLPEIQAARARAAASRTAVVLARADRIPVPSVGPVYEKDESGTSFYGMTMSSPVPVLNAGGRLVAQREAEYRRDQVALAQLEELTAARVRAAAARWQQSGPVVARTLAGTEAIKTQADRMDRLYQAGQTDLVKLLQVRQRLIQAENARLDAAWQAIQAYADLLEATGAAALLAAVVPEGQVAPPSPNGN
jgi:cobalt-zinc-cadmium efflux system outer membrane protein